MSARALLSLLVAAAVAAGPALGGSAAGVDLDGAAPCPDPKLAPVRVAGHGTAAHLADELQAAAPSWYADAAALTGARGCAPITVDLVPGMQDAAGLDPPWNLPHWAAGAALSKERRIVVGVTAEGRRQDRERTLRHELAHVAVADAGGDADVPRWLHEGTARLFGGEHGEDDLAALARARLGDSLPPLAALERGFPSGSADAAVAYAVSARAVRLLEDQGGPRAVARVLEHLREGRSIDDAVHAVSGRQLWQLDLDVERSISLWHAWAVVLRDLEIGLALAAGLAALGGWRARKRMRERLLALVDEPEPPAPPEGVVLSRFRLGPKTDLRFV